MKIVGNEKKRRGGKCHRETKASFMQSVDANEPACDSDCATLSALPLGFLLRLPWNRQGMFWWGVSCYKVLYGEGSYKLLTGDVCEMFLAQTVESLRGKQKPNISPNSQSSSMLMIDSFEILTVKNKVVWVWQCPTCWR